VSYLRISSQTVRDVLKSLERLSPSCKADLVKKVMTDDDVQFHWLIATADFEIDNKQTHDALLKMIVDLYVREMQTIYKEIYTMNKESTQRTL